MNLLYGMARIKHSYISYFPYYFSLYTDNRIVLVWGWRSGLACINFPSSTERLPLFIVVLRDANHFSTLFNFDIPLQDLSLVIVRYF